MSGRLVKTMNYACIRCVATAYNLRIEIIVLPNFLHDLLR
jgi:hypothetical protein